MTNKPRIPAIVQVQQRPLQVAILRADGVQASALISPTTARRIAALLADFAGQPRRKAKR